ncbi:hypothetical protein [Streptomyces tubercidicus]|uniref:hypothetical protein n=1 Tax=Streptomyces tubercidicus TaxID=47759 RepID=UPI003676CB85
MARYALDLYGESYYGIDVTVSYSVGDVRAVQTGYGSITVHWDTPKNTQNWGALRLVRNAAGFPATESDGDVVVEFSSTAPQNVYTDSGLTGGRFYYYCVFLASAFDAYSATTTYQAGDTVAYAGSQWMCTTANTVGVTPAVGATQWQATNTTSKWNRAGQAATLAVADYGYRQLIYDLIPTPYATAQEEVSSPQDPANDAFARYLSVLAWGLDMARTELGEQEHLRRVETMPLSRMERLATDLGVTSEASVTPRLRRYRVRNAAQLAKRRGRFEAISEAIYDLTGYDSEISPSPNLLLDADQAEAYYPRYSAWDPSVTYQAGAVVTYGGYLYMAASNTVRLEAETLTLALSGTPSSTVHGNLPTAAYSNSQQVLLKSNAINQSATFTITVPSTGTYDLSIAATRSYDYGILNFAVDGVTVTSSSKAVKFDGYASAPSPATPVYLGAFALTSGTHSIQVKVVGRNAKSGTSSKSLNNGYQMGVDYITYTPQGSSSGVGVAPTGTATTNAFWTYYTAQLTHALDNPLTGGVSTWEQVSHTAGATASPDSMDVYSGYLALSGSGDNTANLLVMANATGVAATLSAHSIPRARVTAWSATTTYARGSYVSYNGLNYLALLPTMGDTPDADRTHWRPEIISTTTADRFLVSSYGIPLAQNRKWVAGAPYTPDDRVEYQSNMYRASSVSKGVPPTGGPTDNASWAWQGSAQPVYTASAWTARNSGIGTPTRTMYIEWYDISGNLITTINPSLVGTNPDLYVGFTRNSANLKTDPSAANGIAGLTWQSNVTADLPVASSGMAYWGTRTVNQNLEGRHCYLSYDRADNINIGITFKTAPPVGVEHGISFRLTNGLNCWTVSRTRLAKIVSGVVTSMASWTSLPDGARVFVTLAGTSIKVFQYQAAGLAPVQLASIADSFNSTATGTGFFERTA